VGTHSGRHAHERSGVYTTFINRISWFERDRILLKYEVNKDGMSDREITTMDPPTKLASIRSSEVGFDRTVAGAVLEGVPVFGGVRMASWSTEGASVGRVERLGRALPIVVVLAGRGNRVKDWMAGVTRSLAGSTA